MKVLFVHDHIFYVSEDAVFSPGRFAASVWSRFLDTDLVDEVRVVSRGQRLTGNTSGLVQSSVPMVTFDPLYQVKGGADYFRYSSEIKAKLRKHVQEVDVVVIRVPSFIGLAAYSVCRELDKPHIAEVVGCAWDSMWSYGNSAGRLLAPIMLSKTRNVVKQSVGCLYVTRDFLQKKYPFSGDITENASNVHISKASPEILATRLDELKLKSNRSVFKIGMLSNVSVKYKGFDVALKALRQLKDRRPEVNFNLLLAGGGSPDYVRGLIQNLGLDNEVQLVGQLASGEEVLSFLDSLDVFLQPSRQEGLPRSVIEAMSRGCPVLASSAGGIPELLDSEFLHAPGDANKLCSDLERVHDDSDLRAEMAQKNFEQAEAYTDDSLSKRRVDFYTNVFRSIK